jgi:hypothetical protein
MQLISDSVLNYVRMVAAGGFMDTAQRLVFTPASGDYGHGKATYTPAENIACLFNARVQPDEMQQSEVYVLEADLYYALTVTLSPTDRIRITHLHGDAVPAPQTFLITGGSTARGHVLMHAELRLVTDE